MNLQEFFILCSGADQSTLNRTPTDKNKFVGIGGTVFFTAVLAFVAAGYALYTVFDSVWLAVVFGLIWGFMIFNLDRYIVSSMKNRGTFWRDLVVALPRIGLAVIIAVVISKPLELKLFEKEINAELITMEQEVIKEQEDELRTRFTEQIDVKQLENTDLYTQIEAKRQLRDDKASLALAEADGTGGSQRRNMGPIYAAKKAEADRAQSELDGTVAALTPLIDANNLDITTLETQMNEELAAIERQPYDGMAARIDALDRLSEKSGAIALAHIFILFLFIIIESAPVLVKLINYQSPYDLMLHKHEHEFEMFHKEKTRILANSTAAKVEYDTEVTSATVRARIKEERAKIEHELKEKLNNWNVSRG